MNGNFYNTNPYYQAPTRQDNLNMIDEQISRLNQMKSQLTQQQPTQQHQPSINQTFQLAPTSQNTMRYVNTMDDVAKEIVFFDTPFFSKDMSVMWLKNNKGEIKAYELNEIVERDEKDIQIDYLTSKIEELERKIKHESNITNVIPTENATDTTGDDEPVGEPVEKAKPTGVSRVSKSKTK